MANHNSSGAPIEASLASIGGGGGGGTSATYWMRGYGTVSGTQVYWSVTGAPDFAGASAPEVVNGVVLLYTS